MGPFEGEFFSRPGTDYAKSFTRDYFAAVNRYWLDEYRVDGFRYDYVPGMFDGPTGQGYAALVHSTYQHSRQAGLFPRFTDGQGPSRIIQCGEHLPDPQGLLRTTYSNTCWQNGMLDRAAEQAAGPVLLSFAHQLDPELMGYPSEYHNPGTGDRFPVAPLQYIESHDHSRFVNRFGVEPTRDLLDQPYGDRARFYKTQPYVIALYTAKGVPMLWQGQELGENWSVPPGGLGRVLFSRPVHWEYFYDEQGKALIRLYRILGSLRNRSRALSSRGHFYYYDDPEHLRNGVIAFRRAAGPEGNEPVEDFVVILNFTDHETGVWLPWPAPGSWEDQLDAADGPRRDVLVDAEGQWREARVPSNYGAVYRHRVPG